MVSKPKESPGGSKDIKDVVLNEWVTAEPVGLCTDAETCVGNITV